MKSKSSTIDLGEKIIIDELGLNRLIARDKRFTMATYAILSSLAVLGAGSLSHGNYAQASFYFALAAIGSLINYSEAEKRNVTYNSWKNSAKTLRRESQPN